MGRNAAQRAGWSSKSPRQGSLTGELCHRAKRAIAKGDWKSAEEAYARVIAAGTADAQVYNNLATVYDRLGIRGEDGFELIAKAHELAPQDIQIRSNYLAMLRRRAEPLIKAGRFRDALPLLQREAELEPDSAPVQRELGRCHAQSGNIPFGIKHFTRAINLEPNNATYYNDLGLACYELRLLAEAQGAFQQVLKLNPGSVVAYTHLGLLANLTGLTGLAVSFLRRALEVDPNCGEAQNNMALFLRDQGEQAQCREHYLRAIALKPDMPAIFSSYLLSLNDDPIADPEWVAAEHRRFEPIVAGELRTLPSRSVDPERKLRVGYLSPDFRIHSVAFFIAPILEAHDHEQVEVTCYATGNAGDAMTERIRSAADKWRAVYRMTDDELAGLIAEDGIDVLVELSGHTSDNRLGMLARRVAPIQMTYLGYPNTTGLSTMDYRITDAIADPAGQSDAWHSEKLIRVEGGFLAYCPPDWGKDLPVADLPAQTANHVTFGSFNNLAKINDVVLDTWAAVLAEVPGSVMFLKARGLRDEKVQARIMKAFAARGIDGEQRIRMMGHERSAVDHLKLYNQVDVALDTFPYNGTTTTCEALWMGTPVVSFEGKSHAGRVGASLLWGSGLGELVAKDLPGYVEKAVELGKNRDRLTELRRGLRAKFQTSSLMDVGRMARGLEAAYREAWRTYCGRAAD